MDAFNLTYEQALAELMADKPGRRYGPVSARGLLHHALCNGVVLDEYPVREDGTRPAVQVRVMRGTATTPDRYWIRDMTIRSFTDPARA
jgi:hypothetical protein